jgi:hypothetical protein
MALAMHIQILQVRRFSNSATDDELPKRHNEWLCIFQSVILAHSPGLALSMPTAFLSGSMLLCRYLATALKGMADQCWGIEKESDGRTTTLWLAGVSRVLTRVLGLFLPVLFSGLEYLS